MATDLVSAGPCYRCGSEKTSTHSGRAECGPCWTWRKLDSPAADHWARVAREFLSNIDHWDITHFLPAAGIEDPIAFLQMAKDLLDYSERVAKGPLHMA